jgi:O-glycosyl hydrolase
MQRIALVAFTAATLIACSRAHAVDVTVDGGQRHQTIEGFGTCLVSWDEAMDRFYRTPAARRLYADELRFNILRANLWGDGTIPFTADASKISRSDPAFAAKDPRTPVFLAFGKALLDANPKAKIIGTVWSPPAWMKQNGSITDAKPGAIDGRSYALDKGGVCTNRVKPELYPQFARWLVEMVKHYQAHGVPLYAVSAANEPQFTQSFESCVWTAKDLATVTGMVGALLAQEKLPTKLFGPETMTGFNWPNGPNRVYTTALREDPAAWRALGFFATHGYADGIKADLSQNSSAQLWEIIAKHGKPTWVTEGATGGHNWPAPVSAGGVATAIHNAFVAGNASAFVPWQFAEDGDSEHAITTTKGLDKKGYTVRQFSRYIPAGSVRVDATPGFGAVAASAYVTPDGKGLTVVLVNPGPSAQQVQLALRRVPTVPALTAVRTSASEDGKDLGALPVKDGSVALALPGASIVTLTTVR